VSSYQKIKTKVFVDVSRYGNIFGRITTNGDHVSHILNLFYLFNLSSSKKVAARRTVAYRHNKRDTHTHTQIHKVQHYNIGVVLCAVPIETRLPTVQTPSNYQLLSTPTGHVYTTLSLQHHRRHCDWDSKHDDNVQRPEQRRSGQKQSIATCGLIDQQDDIQVWI